MSKINYIALFLLYFCVKLNAQRSERLNYQDSLIEFTECLEIPIDEFIDNTIDFNALFRKVYKLPNAYELKRYEMYYFRYMSDPVYLPGHFYNGKVKGKAEHAFKFSTKEKQSTQLNFYEIRIGPKGSDKITKTSACLLIENHKLKPIKEKWIDLTQLKEFKENKKWKNYDVISMNIFVEGEEGECIVKSTRYGSCFNRWILPCTFKSLTFQLEVVGKEGITPVETLYLFVKKL